MEKRCWTCGARVDEWRYTCQVCQKYVRELQTLSQSWELNVTDMTRSAENAHDTLYFGEYALEVLQQEAFQQLVERTSYAASLVEWSFGEIEWRLTQQLPELLSLDRALTTQNQIQADEWRMMAEELRRRGVVDESEECYARALEISRLDYRLYVGFAETALRRHKFVQAKTLLEKSLPHAPKQAFDYKSYAYRRIAHIHTCAEQYPQALALMRLAVRLSPHYLDGCYDAAQYAALAGEKDECLHYLQKALEKPLYFRLAQKEKNFDTFRDDVQQTLLDFGLSHASTPDYNPGLFQLAGYWAEQQENHACLAALRALIERDSRFFPIVQQEKTLQPVRTDVEHLLATLRFEARQEAEIALRHAEETLQQAQDSIDHLILLVSTLKTVYPLSSFAVLDEAKAIFKQAREQSASELYDEILNARKLALKARQRSERAMAEAEQEEQDYHEGNIELPPGKIVMTLRKMWDVLEILGSILFWSILTGLGVAVVELIIALMRAIRYTTFFWGIGIGMLVGLFIGIKVEGWRFRRVL